LYLVAHVNFLLNEYDDDDDDRETRRFYFLDIWPHLETDLDPNFYPGAIWQIHHFWYQAIFTVRMEPT